MAGGGEGGAVSTPEGRVLADVLRYLALCGIFHFRNNNAPIPRKEKVGNTWTIFGFRKSATPGLPDIIGIVTVRGDGLQALPFACEVKSAKGRQSPAQVEFQRKWEAAGGIYIVARSVPELRAKLREFGVAAK
jgi:hypothetical protein